MNEALLKTLGERIATRRIQMDISQTDFAALVGIHRQTLWLVETGRTAAKISTLMRIADALDLHVTDLLAGL